MKLTFEINTDVATHIINPDYSGLKFIYKNDFGKGKFEVSGSIIVSGEDNYWWDFFPEWDIKAYYKGVLFLDCDWEFNEIDHNKSFDRRTIKLKNITDYQDTAFANFDKEYDINQMAYEAKDLYFKQTSLPVENRPDNIFYNNEEIDTGDMSNFEIADWDINTGVVLSSVNVPPWEYSVTVSYKRAYSYGYYLGTTLYDPDGVLYTAPTADWSYLEDVVFSDRTLPKFQSLITPIYTANPGSEPYSDFSNDADYSAPEPAIEYANVCRRVDDVIEWLFGEMGVTVSFDSTGTSTDSFYSFKMIVGETYSGNDKPYKDLLIMNLTDFIPADDDGQKDVPASITNVSLETLLNYFESLGFEWFLQDRSGTNYFILQHREQKTLASGNPNLLNYFNRNRSYLSEDYKKDDPSFHKIVNETTCNGIDFVGTDIDFYNVFSTDTALTLTDNKIYVDLDDISQRREDVYSETDVSNIVLIAAFEDTTKYYTRETPGKRTLASKNNNELSFSYLAEEMYCLYPDSKYNVNGANLTADAYRLAKLKKYEFTIPVDNIATDFDAAKYIPIFDEESELGNLSQGAYDNIGKLITRL